MRFSSLDKEAKDGLDILLSPFERDLVEDVCWEFDNKLYHKDKLPEKTFEEFDQVPIIALNLKKIIHELRSCLEDRPQFVRVYNEWRTVRGQSIETLETIGNSIGKDRKNCNISRLVGNCTSLVGGGIFVASAALIPFTLGLSTPLAVAGGLTTVLGSATSVGTSVTELALLKKRLQNATDVLDKDKVAFKLLDSRLTSDIEVSRAVEHIMAADPQERLQPIFQRLRNFLPIIRTGYCRLEQHYLIRELVRSLIKDWSFLTLVPCVGGMLLVLALLLEKSSVKDDRPWEMYVGRFTSVANASIGLLGPLATTLTKGEITVVQCTARAVARGVIGVVGMTLDVASIVLTSIDMHKGSVSEEGSKILTIANLMREEATLLDEAYGEALAH